MTRHWHELTSRELAAHVGEDTIALLPLAAIEQHGAHLPLSTDLDINSGLLAHALTRLPRDFPLLILPALALGDSAEHAAFPGMLGLAPETLIEVIVQCGRAAAGVGVRRLVLFNSHGGNAAAMHIAALRLRREQRMLVVKAHYFDFAPPPDLVPPDELRHGLHGGLIETSMMLHLKPAVVRMDQAQDAPSLGRALEGRYRWLQPEGRGAFAWMAGDLNPGGVTGNAAGANAPLGRALVAHYGSALGELLEETRAFRLDDLAR